MKYKKSPILYLFLGLFAVFYLLPLLSQTPTESEKPQIEQQTNETTSETTVVTAEDESILQWIVKGGSTMIYLGIIVAIIIGFSLERYFYFKRNRVEVKGYYQKFRAALDQGLPELDTFLKSDNSILSRILKEGLRHRHKGAPTVEKSIESNATIEIGKLERGLNLLSNLGNLAPLLGFFGTVVGMRHSFLQFVVKAAPTAKDLAGGVEEALITTQAGLLIAIPTYLIYNLFLYAIDNVTIELERCANEVTDHLNN